MIFFHILFLVLSLFFPFAFAQGKEFSLMECISSATENNTEIARAKAEFEIIKERERQSLASLLPSVDVSVARSKVNQDRSDVGSGKINQSYVVERDSIFLRQPIYRPRLLNDFKRSKTDVAAERFALKEKEDLLKYKVSNSYMRILILDEQLSLQNRKTKLLDEQLIAAKKALIAGTGTITEEVELKAAYDKAIVDILAIKQAIKIEFRELSFLAGTDIKRIKKLNSEQDKFNELNKINMEEWQALALENNAGILRVQERIQALTLALSAQKKERLPVLDLNMEISRGSSESSFFVNSETSSKSIGLSLSVPIYRGGGISSKIREASARLTVEEEILRSQEDDIRKQVQKAYFGLSENYGLNQALSTAVKSAKLELSSNKKSAEAGFRRKLDILVSQQKLLNVEKDLFDSKANMLLFWINLNLLSGKLSQNEMKKLEKFFVN